MLKFDFLNWSPDLEDFGHGGLVTLNNVYHQPEGYRAIPSRTLGAFTTQPTLGTCPSVNAQPMGTNGDMMVAYINPVSVISGGWRFTFNLAKMKTANYSITANYTSRVSGTTQASFTTNKVTAFQVCELADHMFVTAQAEAPDTSSVRSVNFTGYIAL